MIDIYFIIIENYLIFIIFDIYLIIDNRQLHIGTEIDDIVVVIQD